MSQESLNDQSATVLRRTIGNDLWFLVSNTVQSPIIRATRATELTGKTSVSFRLEFANGLNLKGLRLPSSADSDRVEFLIRYLNTDHLPKLIARHESALLFEWVDGERVEPETLTPEQASFCGRLQGTLHCTRTECELERYAKRLAPGNWIDRVKHAFGRLLQNQALSRKERERALSLALQTVPESIDIGIIHGDLCLENFILTTSGRLRIIDNETLRIDALDFDLARTWYRWPMEKNLRKAFYEGYEKKREAGSFKNHFFFWALAVLAEASLFRMSLKDTVAGNRPLSLLKSVLRGEIESEADLVS